MKSKWWNYIKKETKAVTLYSSVTYSVCTLLYIVKIFLIRNQWKKENIKNESFIFLLKKSTPQARLHPDWGVMTGGSSIRFIILLLVELSLTPLKYLKRSMRKYKKKSCETVEFVARDFLLKTMLEIYLVVDPVSLLIRSHEIRVITPLSLTSPQSPVSQKSELSL